MNCVICGKEFTPRRSIQKYCSAECRRYANRHGVNDIRAAAPATGIPLSEMRYDCQGSGSFGWKDEVLLPALRKAVLEAF